MWNTRTTVLACLLAICGVGPALPGAWPRDPGASFLSVSGYLGAGDSEGWAGLYYERGVTRRLTFGFDAGRQLRGSDRAGFAFARWDLAPEATLRKAVSLGLGVYDRGQGLQPVIRPGFALGRGMKTPFGDGWMEVEVQALFAADRSWTAAKMDATFGVRRSERTMLILQLQASSYPGADAGLRIVPSMVRKFGRHLSLEAGGSFGLGSGVPELKLVTWLEF